VTLLPQTTALMPGHGARQPADAVEPQGALRRPPPPDGSLEQALHDVGLAEIALTRDASRLSVGQAARVALLRVVLAAPAVLLLDEPEANLDDESAAQVAVLTERFAASGGAVMRVRHQRGGVAATRTLHLAGGHLTEVAR
jgi:putative ABC transport system ATP-binding protein